tara:strand:- start:74459 stop:75235 length:777 start_codon:yes stop_codon:yes gene_type:complete
MRRKLVVGNWKMNGSLAANAMLLDEINVGLKRDLKPNAVQSDVVVCVPFPYLAQCQNLLRNTDVILGAQDVSAHDAGAYTGDTSAAMLCEFDCGYVIVGHSERRAYCAESDVMVAAKVVAALANGLTPIICVGETSAQRDAGETAAIVRQQLDAVLHVIPVDALQKIVIAYEPVWAIGTGNTATPQMAQEVHAMLRAQLMQQDAIAGVDVSILYGGSMKPDNARELLAMDDIDGGLIGGASLSAADFLKIVRAATTEN